MKLSSSILPSLKAPVQSIGYDRSFVKPGILHVGCGAFHRSHQACYTNDLFEMEGPSAWGYVEAEVMHYGVPVLKALKEQDCLYTVIERDANEAKPKIVGSIIKCIDYDEGVHGPIKEALLDPEIKIVSMTVTEGGYYLSDGKFDTEHLAVKADTASPDQPKTLFGLLVQALKQRKEKGIAPFTVMSCDNVPHNGDIAAEATIGMAALLSQELADWIKENVTFPNSMVDRITPATTPQQRESGTNDAYGYVDSIPVFCEPWRQWILEDKFCSGRPNWDKLENVKFVDDVTPFETMKLRILNGGHASLSYPAALLGLTYVHEAVEHPVIGKFLDKLEHQEIVPSVPPVPDIDTTQYWETTKGRFCNPTLNDSIARNCYDGGSRQPKFIVPTALRCIKDSRSAKGLALVSALWCRYCFGTTGDDPQWDRLHALAEEAKSEPKKWLAMKDIYGSLGEDPSFVEAFEKALIAVHEQGAEAAMKEYIES